MKISTKLILSGLIIPGFLTGVLLHDVYQSKRSDYVKICSVKSWPCGSDLKFVKNFPQLKDYSFLRIKIKGFDKEKIKGVHFYLDGKLEGSIEYTRPTENSIKYVHPDLLKPDFEKGEHIVKAILEDYEGNKIESDSYIFEMK